MINLFSRQSKRNYDALLSSRLYNEKTFYSALIKDLNNSKCEVIIESPFITSRRVIYLLPIFQKLISNGVRVSINTRDPHEHEDFMCFESQEAIKLFQEVGADVFVTGGHHRKLAIIDRRILWEGSLNILSQNDSCEIMRRIVSSRLASEMIEFIDLI